ncbi:hypothetical protein PAL_GLEAN10005453 [Pteropus alecto]|uniref:Uncharacterized protein n=1 Tax=Pteropus alecto TaxID=9402 RepID=L5JWZ9_PTEAL|nr:hypothetical protein PAL_GLEAN10005453 [Pteropus alecto]
MAVRQAPQCTWQTDPSVTSPPAGPALSTGWDHTSEQSRNGAGTEDPTRGLFPGLTGQVASSCPLGAVSEQPPGTHRMGCFQESRSS